jgi:uncharacterized spore protein YtfJ
MKIDEVLTNAREAITVRRVFAEPYEKDGLVLIPAAVVGGGAGGGSGHDEKGGEGEGGGFGMSARPAGVYILKNGELTWRPAVDPNRLATMAALVLVAFLLTRPRVVRARAKSVSS